MSDSSITDSDPATPSAPFTSLHYLHSTTNPPLPCPSIHLSIHPSSPHLRPVKAAGLYVSPACVREPLLVCVYKCMCMYVRGSGCMSWPPPACRFMLLIGCMSLYTIASHDWSHAAHAVMARAATAPGRTDGGSDKKQNEGEKGMQY